MEVEELVGWLHLPQSSPVQIVPDTPGCAAEGQERWPLSRTDGHEVLTVWGGWPFPGGDSKDIISLPNKQEAAELMFLVSGAAGTACDAA